MHEEPHLADWIYNPSTNTLVCKVSGYIEENEPQANGELICRAVNGYDELVAALKAARNYLSERGGGRVEVELAHQIDEILARHAQEGGK